MLISEFREKLIELGITQAEFSRELGISPVTVSRWSRGEVPEYASSYLRLRIKLERIRKEVER